jgi:hypothetical protein
MDNGLPPLPPGYEALGDTVGVMHEAASHVRDLSEAASRLSDSLITIGLPSRDWRSQKANLNAIVPALPSITVGAFVARLTEFASTQGASWLRGDQSELARFNEEVAILYKVTRALIDASRTLRGGPPGPHNGITLEQAFSHPRIVAALDGVGEILDDLDALAPYLRPVPMEVWGGEPLPAWPMGYGEGSGPNASLGVSGRSSASRRRKGTIAMPMLLAQPKLLAQRFRALPKRVRWAPLAAVPLLALLIVGVVALSHRPHTVPLTDATLRPAPTQTVDDATSTPTPKPQSTTALPTLTLTLSCRVVSNFATVTIHNASKVTVAWVATAQSPFIATPEAADSLAPGANATTKITGKNGHSPAGVTVTVRATHGSVTTPFSVTCPGG